MEDKEFSMFFEVVCCYHPTEYDPIGKEGLYIKDVRKLERRPTQDAQDGATLCPECNGAVEFCAMGHYVPAKAAPPVI